MTHKLCMIVNCIKIVIYLMDEPILADPPQAPWPLHSEYQRDANSFGTLRRFSDSVHELISVQPG